MPISAKLAKSLDKMFNKTKKELEQIVDKKSEDTYEGMAARNELSRRNENKENLRGNLGPKEEFETVEQYRKRNPTDDFAKGGMAKKKPAAKKTPAKKTVAKKNTYNKNYGK